MKLILFFFADRFLKVLWDAVLRRDLDTWRSFNMLIESIIIKMTIGGAGVGPDYSLTIHGNGKVIYDGVENVKVMGVVKDYIDEDMVVSLLSDFKESGFFSFDDSYSVEDSINKPHTIISIAFPKENGEFITKSVKYHHGAKNVPKELKALEDKINEIADSSQWVGDISEHEGFETEKEVEQSIKPPKIEKQKRPHVSKKKIPVKVIAVAIAAIVLLALAFYVLYTDVFNLSPGEKGSTTEYESPEIASLTTASNINSFGDYDPASYFEQGDIIYIYQEFNNITIIGDTECDISTDIIVSKGNELYYVNTYYKTSVEEFSELSFTTDDTWPFGDYLITIYLVDNISRENTFALTSFTIIDKFSEKPVITVLNPASEVREIYDYDNETLFSIGETIYIYQEYSNLSTINSTYCNIYLNITVNSTVDSEWVYFHFDELTKNETGNYGQAWWFVPDETWPSGIYYVTSYLLDNITGKSTYKTTIFVIV